VPSCAAHTGIELPVAPALFRVIKPDSILIKYSQFGGAGEKTPYCLNLSVRFSIVLEWLSPNRSGIGGED
jgi:hypothetical protein